VEDRPYGCVPRAAVDWADFLSDKLPGLAAALVAFLMATLVAVAVVAASIGLLTGTVSPLVVVSTCAGFGASAGLTAASLFRRRTCQETEPFNPERHSWNDPLSRAIVEAASEASGGL
jgi:hypothetical protein